MSVAPDVAAAAQNRPQELGPEAAYDGTPARRPCRRSRSSLRRNGPRPGRQRAVHPGGGVPVARGLRPWYARAAYDQHRRTRRRRFHLTRGSAGAGTSRTWAVIQCGAQPRWKPRSARGPASRSARIQAPIDRTPAASARAEPTVERIARKRLRGTAASGRRPARAGSSATGRRSTTSPPVTRASAWNQSTWLRSQAATSGRPSMALRWHTARGPGVTAWGVEVVGDTGLEPVTLRM